MAQGYWNARVRCAFKHPFNRYKERDCIDEWIDNNFGDSVGATAGQGRGLTMLQAVTMQNGEMNQQPFVPTAAQIDCANRTGYNVNLLDPMVNRLTVVTPEETAFKRCMAGRTQSYDTLTARYVIIFLILAAAAYLIFRK